jgi:formamidopyrimidine-DNA glycosylase
MTTPVPAATRTSLRATAPAYTIEGDLFLVFHLMIAGRFRWKSPGTRIPGKVGLFALDFEHGR